MPELPDIRAYLAALRRGYVGQPLEDFELRSPFLLRSVEPRPDAAKGRVLAEVARIGKRVVWRFEGGPNFVFHLMVAGRFQEKKKGARPTRKLDLATFTFAKGTLLLTEAGTRKRASLHVVAGVNDEAAFDKGGVDVFKASPSEFAEALSRENHTLKRALTDPRLFDGIGGAYSDEILHAAGLSPIRLTQKLTPEEIERLHEAARDTLQQWSDRLIADAEQAFPKKVTAFREGMAVHGRFGEACPNCNTPVQRIVYASRETNYCPRCQTGGKILADRALSRLLRDDWPKTVDELEK
ncbi:MAG: DNA-formamidopyrimidine glycosylase family protein [Planctomycetota bacterium]